MPGQQFPRLLANVSSGIHLNMKRTLTARTITTAVLTVATYRKIGETIVLTLETATESLAEVMQATRSATPEGAYLVEAVTIA